MLCRQSITASGLQGLTCRAANSTLKLWELTKGNIATYHLHSMHALPSHAPHSMHPNLNMWPQAQSKSDITHQKMPPFSACRASHSSVFVQLLTWLCGVCGAPCAASPVQDARSEGL